MSITNDQSSPFAVSAAEVLHKLVSSNSANGTSFYAAGASVVSQAEFYDGGGEGDTITVKQSSSDEPTEFIMSGVFQIDYCDFYFTLYSNFDPNNSFYSNFSEVKLSFHLLPVTQDASFNFSYDDISNIVENLCALEKKALKEKSCSIHRTVQIVGGAHTKVTQIDDVLHKHNVTSGSDASSEDYIVEVYFTLVHHSIRRSKKSVFNVVLCTNPNVMQCWVLLHTMKYQDYLCQLHYMVPVVADCEKAQNECPVVPACGVDSFFQGV
ncbi:hypothetical protein C8R48DRAFT_673992 [Suillus tomentosus]|nr:hypothetical protein C8R48DRAFT_673992 [Suillus tomentosus]